MRRYFLLAATLVLVNSYHVSPANTEGLSVWMKQKVHGFRFLADIVRGKKDHHRKEENKAGGLTIIGAGMPRTGTKSIEQALNHLGHKVYDLFSILEHNHLYRWKEAAIQWKEHGNLNRIETLLLEIEDLGYTATLDIPMNAFAIPLAELRPEAKVLLSIRDNEEKWAASVQSLMELTSFVMARPWNLLPVTQTIEDAVSMSGILFNLEVLETAKTHPQNFVQPLPWYQYQTKISSFEPDRRQGWLDLYNNSRREIESTIDPERLIVFNVKQGWEPLIEFLGIDDQSILDGDLPFPFVNDRASLKIASIVMNALAIGAPLWVLLFGWALLIGLRAAAVRRASFGTSSDSVKAKVP